MTDNILRVGIIGADAGASWAGASHVPALRQPGLQLAAVATRRETSARAAAEAFGVAKWHADPMALIADPDIDIVTVAVKVPAHRDLVMAALKAGKAVYSEAPLGASLAETAEMAEAARGRHTAIGLQGRHNPSARRAAEILASGRLGRILSVQVSATTFGYGAQTYAAYDYFNKAASGASFMTITVAHVLDVVEAILGRITEAQGRTALLWPEVAVVDTGATSQREIPDHLDLIAVTEGGAPVSVQVLAGIAPEEARFDLRIRGEKGWLRLTGNHLAGVQVGDLTLTSSLDFAPPDAPLTTGTGPTAAAFWAGAAINVGELYAAFARDLRQGTHHVPGFDHALANLRLVRAIEEAAHSGRRVSCA